MDAPFSSSKPNLRSRHHQSGDSSPRRQHPAPSSSSSPLTKYRGLVSRAFLVSTDPGDDASPARREHVVYAAATPDAPAVARPPFRVESPRSLSPHKRPRDTTTTTTVVNSYTYFHKCVDPVLSACISAFMRYQPLHPGPALKRYFEALKQANGAAGGIAVDTVFSGLECQEPRMVDKVYFATVSPSIATLVASISQVWCTPMAVY